MTDAMRSAPTTSITECCFKNIVARQIRTIRTPDAPMIIGCFFNSSLWQTAMWTPTELYTWMLGKTLMHGSMLQSLDTR